MASRSMVSLDENLVKKTLIFYWFEKITMIISIIFPIIDTYI